MTEKEATMGWLEKTFPGCRFLWRYDFQSNEYWVTISRA